MSDFTVEATVQAVDDGDWSQLHRILELVPGTILIEAVEEPLLIFPVQADSPMKAMLFVDGIAKLVGISIVSGAVNPAPEVDYETDEDFEDLSPEAATPAEQAVNDWIQSVPPFDGRVTHEGTVEYV